MSLSLKCFRFERISSFVLKLASFAMTGRHLFGEYVPRRWARSMALLGRDISASASKVFNFDSVSFQGSLASGIP